MAESTIDASLVAVLIGSLCRIVRRGSLLRVLSRIRTNGFMNFNRNRDYQGTSEAPTCHVMAIWTGEKRPPRKGEWYLSGATIHAYHAPNDLSTPYHIAKLVLTEPTVKVVREL